MTLCLENESELTFGFDLEETARSVAEEALKEERCPYECEINVLLTGDGAIREINREQRSIDSSTDVLSFPMLSFETPADFSGVENAYADAFDPETGELLLGDIVISMDHVKAQALEYGHSERREFAFLVAHSMLHLLGYDHVEDEERAVMEEKQRQILNTLKITRENA